MIYPIRSIVAGISTVTEADAVLKASLALSERTGARLFLVHAHEIQTLALDAYSQVGMVDATALQEYYDARRSRFGETVRRATSSDLVRFDVAIGPPATTVLDAAEREEADLIVVGSTRHGKLARAFLGTTAQRVIRQSRVPVLVLREPYGLHVQKVLLTTDLSEFSAGIHEAALDVIETLYSGDEPELRSLHVLHGTGDLPFPLDPEILKDAATEATSRFLSKRRARKRSVAPAIRIGDPGQEIVAEVSSWKPDLLVLGTHARKAPARWLLGSVGEAAARDADCSVLLIPAVLEEERLLPVTQREGHLVRREAE